MQRAEIKVNGMAPKYCSVVRADASTTAAGNRHLEVHADEVQRVSITGVSNVGECIEFYVETWEAP
jgi:hypothetical protein